MSGWEPDDQTGAMDMGRVMSDGEFVPQQQRRPKNRLSKSSNPVARRLAEFCEAAPTFIPNNVASFGGVLLGLRLAQQHPELVDRILDEILVGQDDGVLDATVRTIVTGLDD